MNNLINTETSLDYLLGYVESMPTEDEFDQARKKTALKMLDYLIAWHVEPVEPLKSDFKDNTEHHE